MTITVILIVILFSFIIVHHIYKVKDKLDEQQAVTYGDMNTY